MKTLRHISFFAFAAFLFCVNTIWASPVSPEQARQTALRFYGQSTSVKAPVQAEDFILVYPAAAKGVTIDQAPCYVFNIAGNKGFVIISGDDDLRPVLGYSFSGSFPSERVPSNLQHWMEYYQKQIEAYQAGVNNGSIPAGSIPATTTPKALPKAKAAPIVAPLLENYEEGAINYDQTPPYNNLCPNPSNNATPAVTGCVATAMAQIARYYKHPARPEGRASYYADRLGINIDHNFEGTTYDWDNILCDYNGNQSNYTEAQKNAVAVLMRDMGYASKMNYGYNESVAYDLDALYGMQNNMGYSRHSEMLYRDYYTEGQWLAILTGELDAGRPMYYAGSKKSGAGHAFVCDGYNEEMFFHFNWGWSSWGNGWYWVENLLPNRTGTGAGEGSGGYDYDQSITVNLQPSQGETGIVGYLYYSDYGHMDGTNALKANTGEFSLYNEMSFYAYDFYNFSPYPLDFDLAITYWKDGEFVKAVSVAANQWQDVYYGWEWYQFNNVYPGTDVEPGTYKVCMAARYFDNTQWIPVKAPVGYTSAYKITVSGSGYEVEPWAEVRAENPVISPEGGAYEGSVTVSISCAAEEASLFYSLDGTRPSVPYTGEFTLTESAVVSALAVMPDGETSETVRATFIILTDDCENTTISETFKNGFGSFTAVDIAGDAAWYSDATYGAKISGYNTSGNNEDWLVSSSMNLYNMKSAVCSFSHAINFATTESMLKNDQTCWISTDYNGNVETATWHQIEISKYPTGSNWTFVNATVDFSAYCGEPNVVLAFKYIDNKSEGSPTWEIKDLKIELVCKDGPGVINEAVKPASVKIYPNPSSGHFTVKLNTVASTPVQAGIFTESGTLLRSWKTFATAGSQTIDLSGQSAGIYYLRLTAPGSTEEKTYKLIVK